MVVEVADRKLDEQIAPLHTESANRHCRVCGWQLERPPWGLDGRTPSFETCPCCGVEFGYQDFTPLGATRYRKLWVNAGGQWAQPHKRPTDWDLEPQLEQVPLDFIFNPEDHLKPLVAG